MSLEETANIWSSRLQSLLELANLNIFLPKLHYEGKSKRSNDSVSLAGLILFVVWTVLYVCYKRFLNSILRRMQLPYVRRNRIVDGLWHSAFAICSMVFLTYSAIDDPGPDCPWRGISDLQLGILLHKTFYLHRATTEVLVRGRWLKGWTTQLLAMDIFYPLRQRLPTALDALLLFEAVDMTLVNACAILITLSKNKFVKRFAKLLFLSHFVNWIYIRILLVPASIILLYVDANRNWNIQACLWMWLVGELIDSVRNKEFGCLYSNQCLESSLFPPSTKEAMEFANVVKNHRKSNSNNDIADKSKAQKQKAELWQTLCCAMTVKKKLKKLSESKRLAKKDIIEQN